MDQYGQNNPRSESLSDLGNGHYLGGWEGGGGGGGYKSQRSQAFFCFFFFFFFFIINYTHLTSNDLPYKLNR